MKKVVIAALIACMVMALAGCSKSSTNTTNILTGYKTGDVTLGEYKGLTFSPYDQTVTDEEIQNQIDTFLAQHQTLEEITEREDVQEGDTVVIDFVGKMDGVAFDGGTGNDYELTIGSGNFIPGFEDGLVGIKKGESTTLDLTFPDPYKNNPDYSGKPVQFDVTVKSINTKVDSELTDDFVAANTDYKTIDEYKTSIKEGLTENKATAAENAKLDDVAGAAIKNATFNVDLSEKIAAAKEQMKASYDASAQSYYGIDGATLYSYMYQMTAEQYDEYMESLAKMSTQYNYLLSAIVEAENIEVTDEEISKQADEMVAAGNYESVDKLYEALEKNFEGQEGKTIVAEQLKMDKARDILIETAVEGEAAATDAPAEDAPAEE